MMAVDDVSSGIVSLNLYVNDHCKADSNCEIYQYAEDTVVLSRHVSYADAVNLLQRDSEYNELV